MLGLTISLNRVSFIPPPVRNNIFYEIETSSTGLYNTGLGAESTWGGRSPFWRKSFKNDGNYGFGFLYYHIMPANLTLMLEMPRKKIYWWSKNLSFTRTTFCFLGDTRTIWRRRDHEITRVRLMRLDSALKKVVPDISRPEKSRSRYISAQKISTLFWCTEWAWNWHIIFRCASIHGRACFN